MKLNERYNHYHGQLTENDEVIWGYIKGHREACAQMAINELADACHLSRTTVLRFAKKLGFTGYSELKVTLRQELEKKAPSSSSISQVIGLYNDAITQIRHRDCSDIFSLVDGAERIFVYSTGMVQSSIAREMKRLFMGAGFLFYEIRGQSETNQILRTIGPGDMVFMISYSGEARQTLSFAKSFKIRGVPIVSMTTLRDNPLAQLSDISLYIATEPVAFKGMAAYDSLTAFFILAEMLFLKYCEYKEAEDES